MNLEMLLSYISIVTCVEKVDGASCSAESNRARHFGQHARVPGSRIELWRLRLEPGSEILEISSIHAETGFVEAGANALDRRNAVRVPRRVEAA